MNKQCANKGLTLIDLLITLSIAAIVMTAAVPSYNTMSMNNRRAAAVNGLVADLNLARSEAVKRGTSVSVCKSSNGQDCNTTSDASVWSQGWIVFVDGDSPGVKDSGDQELSISEASTTVYTWTADESFKDFITYQSNGFSSKKGRFTYCDKRGTAQGRVIEVNYTGRLKSHEGATCS